MMTSTASLSLLPGASAMACRVRVRAGWACGTASQPCRGPPGCRAAAQLAQGRACVQVLLAPPPVSPAPLLALRCARTASALGGRWPAPCRPAAAPGMHSGARLQPQPWHRCSSWPAHVNPCVQASKPSALLVLRYSRAPHLLQHHLHHALRQGRVHQGVQGGQVGQLAHHALQRTPALAAQVFIAARCALQDHQGAQSTCGRSHGREDQAEC